MDKYNYEEAVKDAFKEYVLDRVKDNGWTAKDVAERYDELYDDAFVSDSVTGNASGSYTFSTWTAEECLCHNWDLMEEMVDELGLPRKDRLFSAETWDVCIRCYILGRVAGDVVAEVVKEMEEKEVNDAK